jgi:hypothetical protein
VYARALGVSLAQKAYDNSESSEGVALKKLLSSLDLECDISHRRKRCTPRDRISVVPLTGGRSALDSQGQPEDLASPDLRRVPGKGKILLTATEYEKQRGLDTAWSLKAKEAPDHIKLHLLGSSWIIEVITNSVRKGKRDEQDHYFVTSLRRLSGKKSARGAALSTS